MAYNEGLLNTISAPAGADFSGKQFYGVALVNDTATPPGVHASLGVAAKAIAGVLQNNPVAGQAATIQTNGTTKVAISASQTIVGGTSLLELDVAGTFKLASTGTAVAQALESVGPVANIMIISARLLPSNLPAA